MKIQIAHKFNGQTQDITTHQPRTLSGVTRLMTRAWNGYGDGWGHELRVARAELRSMGGWSIASDAGMLPLPGMEPLMVGYSD